MGLLSPEQGKILRSIFDVAGGKDPSESLGVQVLQRVGITKVRGSVTRQLVDGGVSRPNAEWLVNAAEFAGVTRRVKRKGIL